MISTYSSAKHTLSFVTLYLSLVVCFLVHGKMPEIEWKSVPSAYEMRQKNGRVCHTFICTAKLFKCLANISASCACTVMFAWLIYTGVVLFVLNVRWKRKRKHKLRHKHARTNLPSGERQNNKRLDRSVRAEK